MAWQILRRHGGAGTGCVVEAIGNHEEEYGLAVNDGGGLDSGR